MKWIALAALAALAVLPGKVSAQDFEVPPIGSIPQIDDPGPTTWGIGGLEIFRVSKNDGNKTPIMRTEIADARTVEILSRVTAPPIRAVDLRAVKKGNNYYVVARRFLLMEVTAADAAAVGTTPAALARKWAAAAGKVLPQIKPLGQTGV